jgi:hypothetical protein
MRVGVVLLRRRLRCSGLTARPLLLRTLIAPAPFGDAEQTLAGLLRFRRVSMVLDEVPVELEGVVHLALCFCSTGGL